MLIHLTKGIASAVKTKIKIDAYCPPSVIFWCNAFHTPNIDYHGNMTFCCTLSHITNDDTLPLVGNEFLADLNKKPLPEGICRHFRLLARMMEDRIKNETDRSASTSMICHWCLKYFNKLNWLKNYPDSIWSTELTDSDGGK